MKIVVVKVFIGSPVSCYHVHMSSGGVGAHTKASNDVKGGVATW